MYIPIDGQGICMPAITIDPAEDVSG